MPRAGRVGVAAILCVLVHAPTLGAGFVYDDYPYVVDNADLRGGLSRIPRLFGESFPSHAPDRGLYRPLGEGDVDVAAVVQLLSVAGYTGWYVLEQDVVLEQEPAEGEGPAREAARSVSYLKRIMQA